MIIIDVLPEYSERIPSRFRGLPQRWRGMEWSGGRTSIVTLGSGQEVRLEGHLAKNENFERKNLLGEN